MPIDVPSCLTRLFSTVLLALMVGACSTNPGASTPADAEMADPDAGRGSSTAAPMVLRPLTAPTIIVADSQIHESRGTASRYWSLAGDEFVPVTIRTGQQTIGAADILADVLRRETASPLVLHLGDAIDVSCETEWDLYAAAMTGTRGPAGPRSWLFTPGNHDGFLVGNFFPLKNQLYNQGYWDEVCNTGRVYDSTRRYRMSKNGVLEAYLASLRASGAVTSQKTDTAVCAGDPVEFCASVHLSTSEPWTSFIVQAVRLPAIPSAGGPPIFAILTDTSDYPSQPKPAIGAIFAGVDAGISSRQLQTIERVMASLPGDARVFFAGHHPFTAWQVDTWDPEAKTALDRILGHRKSLRLIVTGHTHEGGWYQHQVGSAPVLELNTGSLIDWPAYYRSLKFEIDEAGRLYATSPRHLLSSSSGDQCRFLVIPAKGSGYGIEDQQSESDRQSDTGDLARRFAALSSAFSHFTQFWRAKHLELRPQLLAYADVVDYSMPEDMVFSYRVPGTRAIRLSGRAEVSSRLRQLGKCEDKVRCPAREKETFLYALEKYYWFDASVPRRVRDLGHDYRRCAALWASRESAQQNRAGQSQMQTILHRTAGERRMLPP